MSPYHYNVGDELIVLNYGLMKVVKKLHEESNGDKTINLYLAQEVTDDHDGNFELVAVDNATIWAVGDTDNPDHNEDQFLTIGDRLDDDVIQEIAKVDEGLADFIKTQRWEAQRHPEYEVYKVPNGSLRDFNRGITWPGYPKAARLMATCETIEELAGHLLSFGEQYAMEHGLEGDEFHKFVADTIKNNGCDCGDLEYLRVREMSVRNDGSSATFKRVL